MAVRKDGTRFWADVVITALRDEAGTLIGFSKVTRDLTQRQQAEEERRRLDAERIRAEEALRIRDEFLSVASHELKTPLTALQLELYGMRAPIEKSGDERLERKLARASRSADRLSRLIEMLLDVSRIATGQLTLRREPFESPTGHGAGRRDDAGDRRPGGLRPLVPSVTGGRRPSSETGTACGSSRS